MLLVSEFENQCAYCYEKDIVVDYVECRSICKNCGNALDLFIFDTCSTHHEQNDFLFEDAIAHDDIKMLKDDYIESLSSLYLADPPSVPLPLTSSNVKKKRGERYVINQLTRKSFLNIMNEQLSNVSFDIPLYIKKQCMALLSNLLQDNKYRADNAHALLVAGLYYSYRSANMEHSIEDLCAHFDTNKQKVIQQMKSIEAIYDMTNMQGRNTFTLLNAYISDLSILNELNRKQLRIKIQKLLTSYEDELEGKTSKSIVVSYIAYLLENDVSFEGQIDTTHFPNMSIKMILSRLYNISQATLSKTIGTIVKRSLYF